VSGDVACMSTKLHTLPANASLVISISGQWPQQDPRGILLTIYRFSLRKPGAGYSIGGNSPTFPKS